MDENAMQSIASEMNLSETAFVSPIKSSSTYGIQYFSPVMEIPLCGHATLASSKIMFMQTQQDSIQFQTGSGVELDVRQVDNKIEVAFPVYELIESTAANSMLAALGIDQVNFAAMNTETNILMLEIPSADILSSLTPDFHALVCSHDTVNGICVTAEATDDFDFHSRFFWPWSGGEEDPVTGATHTFLAKYWANKLTERS